MPLPRDPAPDRERAEPHARAGRARDLRDALGARAPPVLPEGHPLAGRRGQGQGEALQRDDRHRDRGRRADAAAVAGAPPRRSRPATPSTTRRRPGAPSCASAGARSCSPRIPSLRGKRSACRSSPARSRTASRSRAICSSIPATRVLMPDKLWEQLPADSTRCGSAPGSRPSRSTPGSGFNATALREALASAPAARSSIVLLNFPNNPTGYMPTPAEGRGDRRRAAARRRRRARSWS